MTGAAISNYSCVPWGCVVGANQASSFWKMGVDVLIEGNAGRFDYRETILVDRKGNPELMKKLSKRLGVSRVIIQIQDKPRVDATLVVGWDRERLRLQR